MLFIILSLFGHIYVQYLHGISVCIYIIMYYKDINIPITRISCSEYFLRLDYLGKVCVFQKL